MELLAGKWVSSYGDNNVMHAVLFTIEETLEMGGVILFIYTLLIYIKEELPDLRISFRENI